MKNDISFIFPHQMKYFTNQIFDLTLAIDCLQDINKKTVNEYFRYIDKFSDYFYYGIWKKTGFFKKYEFKPDNYTIPKNWNIAFKMKHFLMFFFKSSISVAFKNISAMPYDSLRPPGRLAGQPSSQRKTTNVFDYKMFVFLMSETTAGIQLAGWPQAGASH